MTDPTSTPPNPEEPTTPPAAATPPTPPEPPAAPPPVTPPPAAAPVEPAPAAAAPAAAAPAAATPAYAPAAPVAGPRQALSLTSFILGLGALVFSWTLGFGFLLSLAAVILGFLGKGKEPQAPKWMWMVGIIAGFVAMAISIIVVIVWILLWVAAVSFPYPELY